MTALTASQAFAAGYEKTIMWGAKTAGVAGISSPNASGASALYFNPAGLVGEKPGHNLDLELSPTNLTLKGPINNNNDIETSSITYTPGGFLYNWKMSDQWGLGAGIYASGGSKAKFENIALGRGNGDVTTDMTILEYSLGAGYKVNDKLRLGLAWRVVQANADFALVKRAASGAQINAKLSGLKDTQYNGFKLGAQYKASERTTVGFAFRSEVNLAAAGEVGGKLLVTPGTSFDIVSNPATAKTTFPMQMNLGVLHDYGTWRSLAEYSWTQYSRIGEIVVDGTIRTANNALNLSGTTVQQEWKDQHNIRLAGEYMKTAWPIRFGYGWTSQVTNSDYPRASFSPPAMGHTLTAGTGKSWAMGPNNLDFDAAVEYTMASGSGGSAAVGNTTNDYREGTYSASVYSLHLGVGYTF
jgi:long-subunit fatty acid transport protein